VGSYFLTSEYTHHSRHCGERGLLLAGDAFAFLTRCFSSGVMLALKSGTLAATPSTSLVEGDFDRNALPATPASARGVENMRKLVYASTTQVQLRHTDQQIPRSGGWVTDCLSGDSTRISRRSGAD